PAPLLACPRLRVLACPSLPGSIRGANRTILIGRTLSVSHVWPEVKKPVKIFRSGGGDFRLGDIEQSGQSLGGLNHKSRLVALAALGGGSEPGRVGFHQNPVQWHAGGHFAKRF